MTDAEICLHCLGSKADHRRQAKQFEASDDLMADAGHCRELADECEGIADRLRSLKGATG